MHYHSSFCPVSPCCHSSPHYHGAGCSGAMGAMYPVWVHPTPWPSPHGHWWSGHHASPMAIPQELKVDTTVPSNSVLIGGQGSTSLNLEYVPEAGATTPSVKVTVETGGTTSTWTESSMTEGYHTKPHVVTVEAGTTVTLEVTEAIARLRWYETMGW